MDYMCFNILLDIIMDIRKLKGMVPATNWDKVNILETFQLIYYTGSDSGYRCAPIVYDWRPPYPDFGRNVLRGYFTRSIVLSGTWYLGVYFYKTHKGWISVMSPLRHMPGGSYQKTGLREGGVRNFLFQELSPPMLNKVLKMTLLSPSHCLQCFRIVF